jgi:hypothetical protein
MAHPRVADRDGLQIWRVAANILNKQSRPADSGWSFSLGVERGANNPAIKLSISYETLHRASADPVKANEVAGQVARMGEERKIYKVLVGNSKERDHSEDQGVGGRMGSE